MVSRTANSARLAKLPHFAGVGLAFRAKRAPSSSRTPSSPCVPTLLDFIRVGHTCPDLQPCLASFVALSAPRTHLHDHKTAFLDPKIASHDLKMTLRQLKMTLLQLKTSFLRLHRSLLHLKCPLLQPHVSFLSRNSHFLQRRGHFFTFTSHFSRKVLISCNADLISSLSQLITR